MQLLLNGAKRDFPAIERVDDLLSALALDPRTVVVELNGKATPRSNWPTTTLADNDRVEIVQIVAGG